MKKRVIAMLLAGVMALSLTACGGGDSDKGKKEIRERNEGSNGYRLRRYHRPEF